tara:strand:- start:149 stop:598 length:450 start_codon:yes stop_codon:yes gene_type:complete
MQFTQVHRVEQEKVFISVQNNQGAALEPTYIVEFSNTTTDADQGRLVELVDTAVAVTTGIQANVAGVVETTIATGEVGRVQVYGPCQVKASASLTASTIVAANNGGVIDVSPAAVSATGTSAAYQTAVLGWTLENGPSTSEATVFIKCL